MQHNVFKRLEKEFGDLVAYPSVPKVRTARPSCDAQNRFLPRVAQARHTLPTAVVRVPNNLAVRGRDIHQHRSQNAAGQDARQYLVKHVKIRSTYLGSYLCLGLG